MQAASTNSSRSRKFPFPAGPSLSAPPTFPSRPPDAHKARARVAATLCQAASDAEPKFWTFLVEQLHFLPVLHDKRLRAARDRASLKKSRRGGGCRGSTFQNLKAQQRQRATGSLCQKSSRSTHPAPPPSPAASGQLYTHRKHAWTWPEPTTRRQRLELAEPFGDFRRHPKG